ncbi:MAG: alpha/beta hydrolase fold domain-containing protein [Sphingomonas sp.]|uniref:alpha/beta hydrolase fold domain-containing protein n=1 Tax=Sphingomonas sp. TaxID=28214 RepID=UPI003F7EF822
MRQWLLALALAATAGIAAADTGKQPAISAASVRDDTFPTAEARYPGGVVARGHVEYANYVGYRPLQLDLYLHADRAKAAPRPLVIWVHGGGWSRGDARQSGAFSDWPSVLAMLAARGYVVASVDYRLDSEARFPAQVQDVKAAVRFLRSKATDYGIDPRRVYLWGGSAGGHLAGLATVTCGVAAFDPPASTGRLPGSQAKLARPLPQSDCVQGAALWYGVFDFALGGADPGSALTAKTLTALLGCDPTACADKLAAASPITYVKRETPPLLLIAGTADHEVSYHQSEAMAAKVKAADGSVDLQLIAGSDHGFIGKTPADTRRDSLSALDRTLAFFDKLAKR